MSSLISQQDKEKLLSEVMDPEKVVLVCGEHRYTYNPRSNRPPVWNCPQCWKVQFIGLLANTPPNKRDEVLEMLEYSVHKLVEAAEKGQIDKIKLYKHPKVTVTRE